MIIEITKEKMILDINDYCTEMYERLTCSGSYKLTEKPLKFLRNYKRIDGSVSDLAVESRAIGEGYCRHNKPELGPYLANLLDTDSKICRVWRHIKDI